MISKCWKLLNARNQAQLRDTGYNNFKQTLALNYGTWTPRLFDPVIVYLYKRLPVWIIGICAVRAIVAGVHKHMGFKKSMSYNFYTYMLRYYIERTYRTD